MSIESVGEKLKQHRTDKNMSIRELSAISNIASSTISQIETGKNSPNLITLKAICDALDIPVFSLFLDEDKAKIRLVKSSAHEQLIRNISNGKQVKEALIIQGKNDMYAGLIETPPHANSGNFSHHGGEEFVYILEGTLEFDLEGHKKYVLEKGDTLYYPNYIGHRWENKTEEPVRMLIVSTSPYDF